MTELSSPNLKLKTLNVLVVDDEVNMCLACQKSLRHFQVEIKSISTITNYQIDVAYSGSDFFKRISEKKYHLILLDYKLPDASGLELLTHVINQNQHEAAPLVIMITAYATFETAVSATKLGAYDFLAKPFTPDELKSSIKKASIRSLLEEHAREFEDEKKKVRFEFLSVLAHELKAPINAVEGYIKILNEKRESLSESDFKHITERAMIRSQGMRKLIFDLLDLTRIESGEKKRKIELINISDLLKNTINNFEMEIESKEIELKLDIEPEILFNIDSSEFEIIFNNLISNGIKYNLPKGKLIINLKKESQNKSIIFTFSDTGIGIEENDQKRLFQDFIRIKNEHTLKIEGSGLGLSTVKKIVDLYHGKVDLKSTPGFGSTFTLTFPY